MTSLAGYPNSPGVAKKKKKRNGTEDKTKIKIAIMIQKGIFVMSDCKP